MPLVERSALLATLHAVVGDLRPDGGGRLVLVAGEAGAGKTSLVRELLATVGPDVRVLAGGCDPLHAARPFGPLVDWAAGDAGLRAALAPGGTREVVFDAAMASLTNGPAVAVIEDAHWADEATLDLLRYVGRRAHRTGAALVVTYRADEVGPAHPLSVVLGDLAGAAPLRCPVPPLTPEGVARLVGDGAVDVAELHARTGGNPFFVTECLSSGAERVPLTVRDAVLARAARLPADGRAALDAVATVPGRAELWLAGELGASGAGLDACVSAGVLVADGDAVRFRHELARAAVESALLPDQRRTLHRAAYTALQRPPAGAVDHARVTHHAVAAGDADPVLVHAPLAAEAAATAGARREAAALLQLAVERAASLPAGERRALWSRLAEQRALLGEHAAAVDAYEQALAIAETEGDDEARGSLLVRMWSPLTMSGQTARAAVVTDEATALLEGRYEGSALALAYAQRSALHMLARELADAEPWGRRAIDLATSLGDDDVLAYALVQSGVARWMAGHDDGLDRIRSGIELARSAGLVQLVAHGLSQIGSGGGEVRRYPEAIAALEECVAYADDHELGSRGLYAQAWLARCHFEQGRWDEASTLLGAVLRSPRCDGISAMTALTVLGRLRARRGDPDVWSALDEALAQASVTGHLQRLWPVAAARAEAAWLEDRLADEADLVADVHATAARLGYPWASSELALWLWRAGRGVPTTPGSGAATPFALHVLGDVRGAAAGWAALGCPYEEAAALADSDADDDQRAALAALERLGGTPLWQRLAARRRSAGRSVPRGPNAATRGNPGNLTDRELDVLELVAAGLTNGAIAERLNISVKTAGHHVSHVLAKLSARSRAEAVAAAAAANIPLGSRTTAG